MTTRVDERVRRQARARAAAASIIDAPRVARRFTPPDDAPLRASGRRRVKRHSAPSLALPISSISRRRVALAVLAAQVIGLFAILVLPAFSASDIEVRGNHLLNRAQVLAAARISTSQSLFTVDGEQVRQRIEKLPWVRSASVETELPHTVRITISEWTPVLVLHRGAQQLAVADDGSILDLGRVQVPAPPGVPLVVDNRPLLVAAQTGGSQEAIDSTLVRTLVITAQRFPAVFGVAVNHFEWQADGLFAIVTTNGWRAILGHMVSDADVAQVPDQLAALVSLRSKLDLVHPSFGYVDLENPATPAVGGKPGPPDPAPAPRAAGARAAQPSATPAPTPSPRPTPIHFTIGPTPGH
jgi:cell division septal protein FtsQ